MKNVDKFIKQPKKALFLIAGPIMIAMVFQILYNIVDTAFVGRLGANSIAAITFAFPLFFLMFAFTSGIGTGMSSRISRYLGQKNNKGAENAAMHGLILVMIVALFVCLIGNIFLAQIFSIFGASEEVLPLAIGYMRIILFGIFFMFPMFVITQIFIAQGDSKTPIYIQAGALIINIILDPIFIYSLGYGVTGAAIASFIAYIFGIGIALILLRNRSELRLGLKKFSYDKVLLREIAKVGAPASLMIFIMSIYVMFLNIFMAHFSTEHVASFGLVNRLESVVHMVIMSFSMALMTLSGMFYGAKEYKVLKDTAWFGIKISIGISCTIALVFFLFPEPFLKIFTTDPVLLDIGVQYLRINVFTFPLMAGAMATARIMQGMGHGLPGLILTLTRVIFVAVPLAYIFVFVMGYGFLSIAIAMVAGGIAANLVALPWLYMRLRKY